MGLFKGAYKRYVGALHGLKGLHGVPVKRVMNHEGYTRSFQGAIRPTYGPFTGVPLPICGPLMGFSMAYRGFS